jgi:hypothetical protein
MKDYKDFYIEAKRSNLPFIFCDMDGVLTDFVKAANKATGLDWEGLRTNQDWDSIRDTKNFWAKMPWKRDGKKLWRYIKKYNPSILYIPPQFFTISFPWHLCPKVLCISNRIPILIGS